MAAVDRNPILFTDGLVDVTYLCDWCGTETKRAVREPGRAGRVRTGEHRGLGVERPASAPVRSNRRRKSVRRACRQRPSEYGSSKRPDAKSFG
jgi:hypothetical protein